MATKQNINAFLREKMLNTPNEAVPSVQSSSKLSSEFETTQQRQNAARGQQQECGRSAFPRT